MEPLLSAVRREELTRRLRAYRLILWDFDGVIKESVEIKTRAYAELFAPFGAEISARVRAHHEQNGGISRFEKIPLYLSWSGQPATPTQVQRYCEQFAAAVRQAVVDAPWVPGAREYLQKHLAQQHFVLISATPQGEIEDIVRATGLAGCFADVHGAPMSKADAIGGALMRWECPAAGALVIGDSQSDYSAAQRTGVDFLLRRTAFNASVQRAYAGPQCENFLDG
jgi:phosphoglycolate phosphatase-like HAD superfamily hydrolase